MRARTNSQGTTVSKRADPPAAPRTDNGTNNKGDNNSKRNESHRVTWSQKVTDIKGGYVASGLMQGMPVDLLIDSGSDVTLIDAAVYNQILESVRPLLRKTETNLSTASWSPMTTSGEAHFKLQLGNSEWSYPFIVAELGMTTKAILDNNFLRDQESNTDMKLGVLTIDDKTHLLQIERMTTCCRVRLTDSVEILPQHEMCLTRILDRPGNDTVPEKQRTSTAHTQPGTGNWAIHGNSPGRFFKTTGTNFFN